MLIDRLSSPSTGAATMVRPIAVPSLPLAVRTVPVRDRESVGEGKGVDLGGRRIIKKKNAERGTTTCIATRCRDTVLVSDGSSAVCTSDLPSVVLSVP